MVHCRVYSAQYWTKEHSTTPYIRLINIHIALQCTKSYCKLHKLSIALHCKVYTVCMYWYSDAQCLPVEREASLS